ncbi:MAG TPA: Rrf2 family transcriptional regulator [Bryobacteraceae bacterium]|nr:Rrf2 family transcriptional regulator [Bryobacteraceae bacterium]
MRTLSKKTQYTLRALYALARYYGEGPVLIAKLAAEEQIPQQFLEQILLNLKQQGLVASKKGKGGGYQLAKDPATVSIGTIIRMIEGPLAPLPCASESAFRKCEECVDVRVCGTRLIMRQVRDATANILDNVTLAEVNQNIDTAKAALEPEEPLMYYI